MKAVQLYQDAGTKCTVQLTRITACWVRVCPGDMEVRANPEGHRIVECPTRARVSRTFRAQSGIKTEGFESDQSLRLHSVMPKHSVLSSRSLRNSEQTTVQNKGKVTVE